MDSQTKRIYFKKPRILDSKTKADFPKEMQNIPPLKKWSRLSKETEDYFQLPYIQKRVIAKIKRILEHNLTCDPSQIPREKLRLVLKAFLETFFTPRLVYHFMWTYSNR